MSKLSLDHYPTVINSPWPAQPSISIIRGDLIHPIVSGNKLFKLLPHLRQAKLAAIETLISVGGRYSNHLHALAWAGQEFGFNTVGLVRGYPEQVLTPTLIDCMQWGMQIHFVNNKDYLDRYESAFWQPWQKMYPNSICLYEGGFSKESVEGSTHWWSSIPAQTTKVVCAVGSGSTLAGLALSAPVGTEVIGVPVFKDPLNYLDLKQKIASLEVSPESYSIWSGYAGRGFGKLSAAQAQFKDEFERDSGLLLDPVYTSKLFFAIQDRLQNDPKLSSENIAIIHSGGLQGNRS